MIILSIEYKEISIQYEINSNRLLILSKIYQNLLQSFSIDLFLTFLIDILSSSPKRSKFESY
jgi:hypothetical protein